MKLTFEVRKYDKHGDYEEVETLRLNRVSQLNTLGYGSAREIYSDEYVTEYAFDLRPMYGYNLFHKGGAK